MPSMNGNSSINRMKTPPEVCTTKDLMYLKDSMSWLLLAAKKCHFYSQHVQDEQMRSLIDRIGRMHEEHYYMMLEHTQMDNTQAMQSVQPMMQQNQQAYQQMQQQQQQ